MKQEKIDKILNEIYVRLYKESTPTADFNELVENATINEFGLIVDSRHCGESVNNFLKIVT